MGNIIGLQGKTTLFSRNFNRIITDDEYVMRLFLPQRRNHKNSKYKYYCSPIDESECKTDRI